MTMLRHLAKVVPAVTEMALFLVISALILGGVLFLAMCGKEWGC